MVLKYHISPTAIDEDLIVKIWEASNDGPGAEVYTETLPKDPGGGHPAPHTVIADDLDLVVHIVRLYSADSAQLLHNYEAEPRADGVTVFDPIRFKIGDGGANTPAPGDDTYQNDLLIGLLENDYTVHRNGQGYLFPGLHYSIDSGTGQVQLIGPDTFDGGDYPNDGDEITIQRKSLVTNTLITNNVISKWFNGFVDIAVDTDYNSSHLKKMIRFTGSCGFYFRAASSVPIGYVFIFNNFGAGASNSIGTVTFENAPLLWNNTTKSFIDLKLYWEGAFVYDGTNWNVIYLVNSSELNGDVQVLPGAVLGRGRYNVGDVPGGNGMLYTITHGLNIAGDYDVQFSIMSNSANMGVDTRAIGVWKHHATNKANAFLLHLHEFAGDIQNITIVWLLIKA